MTGDDEAPSARRKLGVGGSIAAAGAFLLAKLKLLWIPLKALKLGKLFLTSASMALMIWFEAERYGLPFAVGFVLLILIHELGHGWAIRRSGLSAGWPVFVPFLGAMISLRGQPQTAAVEADIAYAGPVAGTAASLAVGGLGLAFDSRLALALAYSGCFLNLFNMIPVRPLDGGRVAQAFSRRAWVLGAVLLGAMFFLTRSPQLLVIGVLAATRAWDRGAPAHAELGDAEKRRWTLRYFGLCFFLGAALYFLHRLLEPASA